MLASYKAKQEAKTLRENSIQRRKEYTAVITAHGVSKGGYPNGFAICTNAGYLAVYGLNAIGPVKSMACRQRRMSAPP